MGKLITELYFILTKLKHKNPEKKGIFQSNLTPLLNETLDKISDFVLPNKFMKSL